MHLVPSAAMDARVIDTESGGTALAQIGHYRLIRPIGRGGFSIVYYAIDERLDAPVAIKVLADNHALEPQIRKRFLSEAQLLRKVACSAVITVHDVGETTSNQPYIVLELADRGDLQTRYKELIDSDRTIAQLDVTAVADALNVALSRLHAAGVVHRDIKPHNLLIVSNGPQQSRLGLLGVDEELRLGDLGFAKDLKAGSGLTVGGGTEGFNAPEQRTGFGTIDHRADVYGASALVFWLLTQSTPSTSANENRAVLDAVPQAEPFAAALLTGLAQQPAKRFTTIEQWHEELTSHITRQAPVLVSPPIARPDTTQPPPSSTAAKFYRALPIAVVLVVIAALALALILWWQRQQGPTMRTLDDGRIVVEDAAGGMRLGIFGPGQVVVGEAARFEPSAIRVVTVTWIASDGATSDGTRPLIITPTEPGQRYITLVGTDELGRIATVTFEYEVTP